MARYGEQPCRSDMLEHCSDALGDQDKMRQCIRENFNQLSQQCKSRLMEMRQQQQVGADPGERPCRNDMIKYCSDAPRVGDKIRQCIRENFIQFSQQCQMELRKRRQQQQGGTSG